MKKNKKMDEEFVQSYFPLKAKSNPRIGHDSIKLLKWIGFFDRCYGNK